MSGQLSSREEQEREFAEAIAQDERVLGPEHPATKGAVRMLELGATPAADE